MDDPNVNQLFQKNVLDEFSITYVGTCSLHIVNSVFGKAVKSLKESAVNLDGYSGVFTRYSFLFFFENSQSEQYNICHETTEVYAKMMKKDFETG